MAVPKIDRYQFGEIVVDGKRYARDVIVYPDHVEDHWRREQGHSLTPEDIGQVLQSPPDVLVIGQGTSSRMDVPFETRRKLREAGIRVVAEPTPQACETYNQLRRKQRVVAALHLTC